MSFERDSPFVLLLRSFESDGAGSNAGWREIPLRLLAPYLAFPLAEKRATQSEEEVWCRALPEGVRFVAVGRPHEDLPELGAERIYVRDRQWIEKVEDPILKSDRVIARLGDTEGLWWELRRIMQTDTRPKAILSFDPAPLSLLSQRRDWRVAHGFRQKFLKATGYELPGWGTQGGFVFFDEDGSPGIARTLENAFGRSRG